MKTKKLMVLSGLVLSLLTLSGFKAITNSNDNVENATVQKGFVIYATYDGHEEYGYNFITKDKEDEEYTLTFQQIENSVLKEFDLDAETFVGAKFKVTFNKEVVITKDADGYDDENDVNTITALEKVQ